jgi:hypothetical protein
MGRLFILFGSQYPSIWYEERHALQKAIATCYYGMNQGHGRTGAVGMQ